MKPEKRVIEQYIHKHTGELINLCRNLIQAKSENPPGDVSKPTQIVQTFLRERGIAYKQLEPKPGHVNTIASMGGRGKTLILCGHSDVVPAGDASKWSFPPYSGAIRKGEILGRGSTDMKGGVAATLMALAAVQRFEEDLLGKVTAAIVCDEETGGEYGAKWLIENGKLIGDACLITEPSAYLAVGYTVDVGERGAYWLRFTALGKPAHGSWPAMGRNAILTLTDFLPKLRGIEDIEVKTPKNALKLVAEGQKVLAETARRNRVSVNSLTRILNHYTANVGTISGGTKTNVVPEKCEAEVDFRIPIGGSKREIEAYIQSILPREVGYEVLQESTPSYSPADEPLIQVIRRNVREFFGVNPPAIAIWATSDAWRFRKFLGIPTATFGPGFIEKAHSYDETVSVRDIVNSAKVYAGVIVDSLSR